MELQGSVSIPAPVERVWQALNDPDTLRRCIPGCEEVRQISAEEMHARVMLKLGPVRANFVGKVLLTDVRPLQGCTLNFEGSGGSAGFARGSSVIVLTPTDAGTDLTYTAQASVAGKLGQIGGRLMDASARQLSNRFFEAFKADIAGAASASNALELNSVEAREKSTHSAATSAASSSATLSELSHFPVVSQALSSPSASHNKGWFDQEKARLLWFAAGVVATSAGMWMGTHWLR